MADTGLASFVAGLAGATRVPQVSNDAFYNDIIRQKLNEKQVSEARAYQEQQTEKAMKYQKELLWERQAAELEAGRNAQLSQWVNTNMPLVNRKDKKSVEQYNKDYEMMRKQIWSKNGKLEYMPEEEKPKGKGFTGFGEFLFGKEQGEKVNKATAEALLKAYQGIGEKYKEGGVAGLVTTPLTTSLRYGTVPGQAYGLTAEVLDRIKQLQEAEKMK